MASSGEDEGTAVPVLIRAEAVLDTFQKRKTGIKGTTLSICGLVIVFMKH